MPTVSVYIHTRLKNRSKVQTNQPTNTVGLEFRQSNTHTHTHTHKYTESNIVQRSFPPLSFWLLHVMICKGADHIIYIHRLQTPFEFCHTQRTNQTHISFVEARLELLYVPDTAARWTQSLCCDTGTTQWYICT
jgi:hypothetical protein